jgi:F-type H+-transporting ATPase subunit gamma
MSNLKDTKRRIGSVKNTQKITRAMKLVSAAKYARANQAAIKARPYGDTFDQMVRRLASASDGESPLLTQRDEKKVLLIVIATDRGLCGSLNTFLFKRCGQFLDEKKEQGVATELVLWGRRAGFFGKKRKEKKIASEEKVLEKPSFEFAAKAAKGFATEFENAGYDRVYVAYSKFVNALTQEATVEQILPVMVTDDKLVEKREFIFEPEQQALLDSLLSKQLGSKLFRIFLEGAASEHAARMTAMDNATNNADEVIKRLTLQYNRARQAAITTELIEITSGADAL